MSHEDAMNLPNRPSDIVCLFSSSSGILSQSSRKGKETKVPVTQVGSFAKASPDGRATEAGTTVGQDEPSVAKAKDLHQAQK